MRYMNTPKSGGVAGRAANGSVNRAADGSVSRGAAKASAKNYAAIKDSVARRFLEGPKRMKKCLEDQRDSLENLKAMICSTTSHLSAAPSGSRNVHAREDLIAVKMDLEKKIEENQAKLEEMKAEVILAIMTLEDTNQQSAIRYRYLDGYANWEAADRMSVDIRSVQRYVRAGCQAMKLPDRFYKKKATDAGEKKTTYVTEKATDAGEKAVGESDKVGASDGGGRTSNDRNAAPGRKDESAA